MSYLVIARKFRPQKFADVVGQEHITTALANAIVRDRVPHALLFTGPRGVGKTSMARVFAKALNCSGRTTDEELSNLPEDDARLAVEPCGECVNCKEIAKSSSIAVWEIDGASNNSVDNVREVIHSLQSAPPPNCRYKIYIIDEVHMLSVAAFNALLKSLEEPPPNTIFIFATTEPHKIPETVVSRCQRHDFRKLTEASIAGQLRVICEAEGVAVDDDVFSLISRKAQGGMRDAQSMLDRLLAFSLDTIDVSLARQVFGAVDRGFFVELSAATIQQNVTQALQLLDTAFSQSLDIRNFIGEFVAHWRTVLLLTLAKEQGSIEKFQPMLQLSEAECTTLSEQLSEVSSFDAQRLFDLAEQSATAALQSSYPRYVIEAAVSKMAMLPSLLPLPQLIDSLEQVVQKAGSLPVVPQATTKLRTDASERKKPPTDTPQVKAAKPQQEKAPPETSETGFNTDFNPSWHEFVNHVQSRGEVVLAAHLRRVAPVVFLAGKMEIAAPSFDYNMISSNDSREAVKRCLHSYSGSASWVISITDAGIAQQSEAAGVVTGSIAEEDRSKLRAKNKRIEQEAREDDLVQDALKTFSGSSIEKVAALNINK